MLFSFVLCERLHRFLENKEVGILDDPCFTQHYVLNKAWRVPSIHFFGLNRHVWSPGNLGELQWRPRPGAVSREVSGPTAAGRVLQVLRAYKQLFEYFKTVRKNKKLRREFESSGRSLRP